MELTAEQKDVLEARYRLWGLDQVRLELARPQRDEFAHAEVTDFARAWVKATEWRLRRRKCTNAIFAVAAIVVIGTVIGYFVTF